MVATSRRGATAVLIIAVLVALGWTAFLLFALYMATFVQCFMNEHCGLPWGWYALIIAGYSAGLVAGRCLVRRMLRLLEERAIKRRDGIL